MGGEYKNRSFERFDNILVGATDSNWNLIIDELFTMSRIVDSREKELLLNISNYNGNT